MVKEPEWCCFGDGRRALRKVGTNGYCIDHMAEAFAATAANNRPVRVLLAELEGAEEPVFLMEVQKRRRG